MCIGLLSLQQRILTNTQPYVLELETFSQPPYSPEATLPGFPLTLRPANEPPGLIRGGAWKPGLHPILLITLLAAPPRGLLTHADDKHYTWYYRGIKQYGLWPHDICSEAREAELTKQSMK